MDDAGARSENSTRPRRRLGDRRQRLHRGRTRRDPRDHAPLVRERDRRRPLRAGWRTRHAPNEYVLLLGPTSTARKGDTARIGTRPLEYADPGWCPRIQNGFGSGEGVVWEVRDEIVELESDESDRTVDAGSSDKNGS